MMSIRFIAVGIVALTCFSLNAVDKSVKTNKNKVKAKTTEKVKAFDDPSQLRKAIEYILTECYFENQEKFKELSTLRKTDRKKFLQTIIPLIKAEAAKRKAAIIELKKLVDEYKQKPSDSIGKRIKDILAQSQDKAIRKQQLIIGKMESKLKERKARLEKLVSKRDETINKQFQKLTAKRSKQW